MHSPPGIQIVPVATGYELHGDDGTVMRGFGTLTEVHRFLDDLEMQRTTVAGGARTGEQAMYDFGIVEGLMLLGALCVIGAIVVDLCQS